MKPSETTAIYVESCRSRRIVPQEEEGRLWHKLLALYDAKDVRAALDVWWADTTLGKDGEPRGKWMPAPTELKPLVERVVRDKAARAAVKRYLVCWLCKSCRHRMSGFLSAEESSIRKCPAALDLSGYKCNTEMVILHDERPQPCKTV